MTKQDTTTGDTATEETASITLTRIQQKEVQIGVKGTAPLIVNRFSEKAKQMMLDNQTKKTRTKKEAKNPDELYQQSLYVLPDGGFGFPASGFKAAMVGAARFFEGVAMTQLKQALYVVGEGPDQLVRINGEPHMREDNVRIAMGTADLRFRGQFNDWSATITIRYIPTLLSLDSVAALLDAGGFGGIGEWRPSAPKSATGSFGTFQVIEQ